MLPLQNPPLCSSTEYSSNQNSRIVMLVTGWFFDPRRYSLRHNSIKFAKKTSHVICSSGFYGSLLKPMYLEKLIFEVDARSRLWLTNRRSHCYSGSAIIIFFFVPHLSDTVPLKIFSAGLLGMVYLSKIVDLLPCYLLIQSSDLFSRLPHSCLFNQGSIFYGPPPPSLRQRSNSWTKLGQKS